MAETSALSPLHSFSQTVSGLVLSPADINLGSPNRGLLSDSMTDVPVDAAAAAPAPAGEGLTEAEEEELRAELAKVPCLGWLGRGDLTEVLAGW